MGVKCILSALSSVEASPSQSVSSSVYHDPRGVFYASDGLEDQVRLTQARAQALAQAKNTPTTSMSAGDRLKGARSALEKKDYRGAEQWSRLYLGQRAGDAGGLLILALSLYYQKKHNEAHQLFSQLAARKKLPSTYYFHSGYSAFHAQDYLHAATYLVQVDRGYKDYDIAMYYTGASYYEMEEYGKAKKYLSQAVVIPGVINDSKKTLMAEIEERLAPPSATSPRVSVPSPVPPYKPSVKKSRAPSSYGGGVGSLREVPTLVGVHARYGSYGAIYDPPRPINPYGYGQAQLMYQGGWDVLQSRALRAPLHIGLDLDSGLGYELEYLRNTYVPHTTDLLGMYHKLPLALDGKRHDNIRVFLGAGPWLEWQIIGDGIWGIEAMALGHYGSFEQTSLQGQGYAASYAHIPISGKVMFKLRAQADWWPHLSTGDAKKYAASMVVESKVQPFLEIDISGATAVHRLSRRSYVGEQTHSAELVMRYVAPVPLYIEFGGLAEKVTNFRIHPGTREQPIYAQGTMLGVRGSIGTRFFQRFHASLSYTSTQMDWDLGAGASGEFRDFWARYAPTSQDILLLSVSWDLDLTKMKWKGF